MQGLNDLSGGNTERVTDTESENHCSFSADRWVMEQSCVNISLPLDPKSPDSVGLD